MQMTDCVTSDSHDQISPSSPPNTKHTDTVGYFVAKGTVSETKPAHPADQQLPPPPSFVSLPALFVEMEKILQNRYMQKI